MSTAYLLPTPPLGGPELTIARWFKRPGDAVAAGDPLLITVNDRVEMILPAQDAGVLEAILAPAGAVARAGDPVARIGPPASSVAAPPVSQEAAQPAADHRLARATPVALRVAAQSEVDIARLAGSGPSGRIVKIDVLAALAERAPAPAAQQPHAPASEQPAARQPAPPNAEPTPPTAMRRAIAAHMVRSRATSPHALTAMEADMGRVAEARSHLRDSFARRGLDLTYTACIAQAVVEALMRYPLLNSAWNDDGIIQRRRIHLGIAVALPNGLITPVVRDAQDLNLRGLARAIGDLGRRARAGALLPGEASGATFTLTNPGAGSLWFGTPIINQPQSAILGVGAIQRRPLVISEGDADRIVVRPVALLTLSYDARALDQPHADAFLADVKRRLERFRV